MLDTGKLRFQLLVAIVYVLVAACIECQKVGAANVEVDDVCALEEDCMCLLSSDAINAILMINFKSSAEQLQQQDDQSRTFSQKRLTRFSKLLDEVAKRSDGGKSGDLSKKESVPSDTNSQQKPPSSLIDPLNILREIYLDQDSHVITMLSPDIVQKFHPNGRYGRRSDANILEPAARTELGRLNPDFGRAETNEVASMEDDGQQVARGKSTAQLSKVKSQQPQQQEPGLTSQDLSKLLECTFTGISYLYWCTSTRPPY